MFNLRQKKNVWLCSTTLSLILVLTPAVFVAAQTETTGGFIGRVTTQSEQGPPVPNVPVQFINQGTGVPTSVRTGADGEFKQGLLPPGLYTVRVIQPGFERFETVQRVVATQNRQFKPLPIVLIPTATQAATTTEPTTTETARAEPTPTPAPGATPTNTPAERSSSATGTRDVASGKTETGDMSDTGKKDNPPDEGGVVINTTDARRGGFFTEEEVSGLPLGSVTRVRTVDELALLLPGVYLSPQTLGRVAGPGVGPGVGSAGQFSVNGLPSRANNFTVDGSDNNDEDIGVRRQGFFSLIAQPIESIQEYNVITLLAPAQFGRNIGAQVNVVSKQGGNSTHGALYGFLNTSQLNAREFFDTTNGTAQTQLRAGNNQGVLLDGEPLMVRNGSGGKDSFTLAQGGLVIGGPIVPDRAFYFFTVERQVQHASEENSFAVPTVDERGIFGTGATGIFQDPVFGFPDLGRPQSTEGASIFSLIPFPNNPGGIYGRNTFTQTLPNNGEGWVASGRYDQNFGLGGKQHSFTARYNFTQDRRDIPVTGGAIFSRVRPRTRTQNISTFLNTAITSNVYNQARLSYGRTRLIFEEGRDPFLIPSELSPNEPFLLNARRIVNFTTPAVAGQPNTGAVTFLSSASNSPGLTIIPTVEQSIGRVGQISILGYSPIGVDVFNFPQRRVNNTYQLADTLTWRRGRNNFTFGADTRRTELNSALPRNSRTLLTFINSPTTGFLAEFGRDFVSGVDLAAGGAPNGAFLSLARSDPSLGLRYYQLNFFGQDDLRIRPRLSLSFGLRYEYNTPPTERGDRIEGSFTASDLSLLPGLSSFIAGRRRIYDPDRNNFAPRVGLAYSPTLVGNRSTVIRVGYGIFYDQILGAVVSQSRNVFPNFVTVNTGGFTGDGFLTLFNPARGGVQFTDARGFVPLVRDNTLNTFNPSLSLSTVVDVFGPNEYNFPSPFSVTLPARRLQMPMAQHYSATVEQELNSNLVVSAAYVGTQGRHLLRFTTPNLGPNNNLFPDDVFIPSASPFPQFTGFAFAPGLPDRPIPSIGAVNIFETSGNSRYDALQVQLRGRFSGDFAPQFQVSYTYGKATDDVSDVFDLAGASALPQDSLTFAGERAPSNFDTRHRIAYNFLADLPRLNDSSSVARAIFGGWQLSGTGMFNTGQPFTVNSTFDVNLDGNLTDRPNTTTGIVETDDNRQPLRLTVNPLTLLAPTGQNGSVPRNSFRAGNLLLVNFALAKHFPVTERQRIAFRAEVFNATNRANFGIPVRFLEAPGFGHATQTVTPGRRIQFALKYIF